MFALLVQQKSQEIEDSKRRVQSEHEVVCACLYLGYIL